MGNLIDLVPEKRYLLKLRRYLTGGWEKDAVNGP